VSLTL
jgi:hypothetical protein